jgi:hypothetical protein
MEVGNRQQFSPTRRQPFRGGRPLAVRAMPVAATNGCRPLPALWADPVMGSWRRADRVFEQVATSPLSITKYA